MYAQLGNILFDGQKAFESFSRKDTTAYAQHDLVSGKPRLQPIGNDLEELSISLRLRIEFCDVSASIRSLKNSKDAFEVLPLVMGNGRYMGDYVVIEMSEQHNVTFADGALIEASVTLSLKEFVTPDKLLQQQQAARKRAFAVNATPVNTGLKTDTTLPQQASVSLAAINSVGRGVDGKVINYSNNTSQQNFIGKDILKSIDTIKKGTEKVQEQLQALEQKYNPADILSAALSVKNAAEGFAFPISSFEDLKNNNLALQTALGGLKNASTVLNYLTITRRG